MWKYVSRRVKDSIQLGINVRKSFTVQQNLNHNNTQDTARQQQQQNARAAHHINFNLIPKQHDPSRDKDKNDEKFKRKYQRLNNHNKCLISALTWSTAIVTGFYASQLLCLYRRNQRLAIDGSRCYYSKYVVNTTQSIHRNVQYLLTEEGQRSLIPSLPKLQCPFKKAKLYREARVASKSPTKPVTDDEFMQIVDPGYKQHETFYGNFERRNSSTNVHNFSNGQSSNVKAEKGEEIIVEATAEEKEDAAIDDAIRKIAKIVGELEFQMGLESVLAGEYKEAVDHFKMSSAHGHPAGVFNLALCYEQGVGVRKNMKNALKLYEMASELGHAKASYNLGVFYAQGLGGARKDFKRAKKFFEKAAELGSIDAIGALSLLLPLPKKLPIFDELDEMTENDFYFKQQPIVAKTISAMATQMRVAVS